MGLASTYYPRVSRYTLTGPAGVLHTETRRHDRHTAPHEKDHAASLVCRAALEEGAPDGVYSCTVEQLSHGTGSGLGGSVGTMTVERSGATCRGRAQLGPVEWREQSGQADI
jgi:hypothetical protein